MVTSPVPRAAVAVLLDRAYRSLVITPPAEVLLERGGAVKQGLQLLAWLGVRLRLGSGLGFGLGFGFGLGLG